MTNRIYRAAALFLVILSAMTLFAHQSGKHFIGNVKSFDSTSLIIITTTNEVVTVKLLPTTKFVASTGQPASLQSLKPDERVVIHAKQSGTAWEAEEIDISAATLKK